MSSTTTQASLAIVGDVHRHWRREDGHWLERTRPDLAVFVGDLGDEDLPMVRKIAKLQVPKAVILGNHDAYRSFSEKRPSEVLRSSLDALGDDHLAYGVRELPAAGISVIGARPFSWGGKSLRSPEIYEEFYGVGTHEESARMIVDAARSAQHRDLVVIAHNGPKGLSQEPHDIYGKDFGKPGGDWGDEDLQIALGRIADIGMRVRCVIAGHMHHRVIRGGLRTRFLRRGDTLFVNPAVVPRHRRDRSDGSQLSHFMRMTWSRGELVDMDEVWIDSNLNERERWQPTIVDFEPGSSESL